MQLVIILALLPKIWGAMLYNHQVSSLVNQTWMSSLDDGIPIRKMNILGTHSSMAGPGWWLDPIQAQAQSLSNQLKMGVRALDIRCRHYKNGFPIHQSYAYLNTDLAGVLNIVQTFLTNFPRETVLMRIGQQFTAASNTETFEATYKRYQSSFSNLIWNVTTQDPSLGEVRGKVVIIQDFGSTTGTWGLLYASFSILPHKYYVTNWDQYSRWVSIKSYLTSCNTAGASCLGFWTGSGGSAPYFCASGKSSPCNGCPRLATGLTTPAFSTSYPDFPRVACFIGICTIAFEGINILASNYINSNNLGYIGIAFTDFMGDDLLTWFTNSNFNLFGVCTSTQRIAGCTACSKAGVCIACSSSLNLILDSGTNLCVAKAGYYLSTTPSAIGISCSLALIGCLLCNSSSICTLCDNLLNYQLSTSFTCQAATGYYLNGSSFPIACGQTGCLICTGPTTCTNCSTAANYILSSTTCACDSSANFVQSATADACICTTGYYMLSTGGINSCELMPICPNMTAGCLSCSGTTCTTCDTANNFQLAATGNCLCLSNYYFLNGSCIACNTLDLACDQCASASLCLSCLNNFTLINGSCQCSNSYYALNTTMCLQCQIGCLSCTTSTSCTICNTANGFINNGGICECPSGFFANGNNCQPCSAVVGCTNCAANGTCLSCNSLFGFSLVSGICICNSNAFVNVMTVCQTCIAPGCLTCMSQTICTSCDTSMYYLNSSSECADICGDGILIDLECDDGNVIDGDGCSSICTIQTNYKCAGGSLTTPSECSYSGVINMTILSTIKDATANQFQIIFSISPNLAQFSLVNFTEQLKPQFYYDSLFCSFDPNKGQLTATFNYSSSLNSAQNLNVTFVPPSTAKFYYMQNLSSSLPFTTDNNLALKSYDSNVYNMVPQVELLVKILTGLYLISAGLCLFLSSKLIAVEMMLVLQIAFTSLGLLDRLESLIMPLTELWIINGVNPLIQSLPSFYMPPRFWGLNYKGYFLTDTNICLVLLLVTPFFGLGVYLWGRFMNYSPSTRAKGIKMIKQWGLSVWVLLSIHQVISVTLNAQYGQTNIISMTIGFIIISGLIVWVAIFLRQPAIIHEQNQNLDPILDSSFGQYQNFFRSTSACNRFYIYPILYRIILSILIATSKSTPVSSLCCLGITAVYFLLLAIWRPYIVNSRPLLNCFLCLVLLSIVTYYRFGTLSLDAVNFTSMVLPFAFITLLFLSLILNTVFWIYKAFGNKICPKNFPANSKQYDAYKLLTKQEEQMAVKRLNQATQKMLTKIRAQLQQEQNILVSKPLSSQRHRAMMQALKTSAALKLSLNQSQCKQIEPTHNPQFQYNDI